MSVELYKLDGTPSDVVLPEFMARPRPICVDPALLAMDRSARIVRLESIGSSCGCGICTVEELIEEIEARIARQKEGFFTIDEVAQVLTDAKRGNVSDWIERLSDARIDGVKLVRGFEDRLPMLKHRTFRSFMNIVQIADVNRWLDSLGVGYRFPKVALATNAPIKKEPAATRLCGTP